MSLTCTYTGIHIHTRRYFEDKMFNLLTAKQQAQKRSQMAGPAAESAPGPAAESAQEEQIDRAGDEVRGLGFRV